MKRVQKFDFRKIRTCRIIHREMEAARQSAVSGKDSAPHVRVATAALERYVSSRLKKAGLI